MSKKRRAKIPPFRVLNSENIFRKFVSKIMRSCDKNFAQLHYHRINIESQIRSEDSLFSYYKELIALRKSAKYQEVLTYGEIVPEALKDTELLEDHSDRDLIAFSRRGDGKKILIAANFGTDEVCLSLKNIQKITVLVSNMKEVFYQGGELRLRSCEAVVLEII